MLIILLVFALIRTLHGGPLAFPSEPPGLFTAFDLRDTQTHLGQRGVNDIVISCFATIFACTWSAVHPNIVAVTDSPWDRFKRQFIAMICALLAPEMMTLWAINQRVGAKAIMDDYNREINGFPLEPEQNSDRKHASLSAVIKGWFQAVFDIISGLFQESPLPPPFKAGQSPPWTLTHGFFLQMGGFMLCENGRPVQTLIDSSRQTSKEETRLIWNIQNKVIDPPRITEEDIKDRGKGDAISKTFILLQTTWFIVQCIARWSQRLPVTELEVITLGFAMLNGITYGLWWHKPQNVGRPVFLESKKSQEVLDEDSAHTSTTDNSTPDPPLQRAHPRKKSWLHRKLRQELDQHAYSPRLLWRIPFRIFQGLLHPLRKTIGSNTVTEMRVGEFYTAYNPGNKDQYATAVIGVLFGSIHLIPSWFLDFPSHQEMWLWRVCAIIIIAEPLFWGLACWTRDAGYTTIKLVLFYLVAQVIYLYPFARIILLILSLTSLHSLPPAALQTIKWTTFIPHL